MEMVEQPNPSIESSLVISLLLECAFHFQSKGGPAHFPGDVIFLCPLHIALEQLCRFHPGLGCQNTAVGDEVVERIFFLPVHNPLLQHTWRDSKPYCCQSRHP